MLLSRWIQHRLEWFVLDWRFLCWHLQVLLAVGLAIGQYAVELARQPTDHAARSLGVALLPANDVQLPDAQAFSIILPHVSLFTLYCLFHVFSQVLCLRRLTILAFNRLVLLLC